MSGDNDVQDNVDVNFNVNDQDAARRLGVIAGATGRLGEAFRGTFGMLTAAGGIAGLFAVGHTVQNINQTYQAVARVRAVTGMTAQDAHAMLDSFELAGVEASVGERMLTQMSRKAQTLEQGMAGASKQADSLNRYYKAMGVNLKDGPKVVLQQMAAAAEKGKLSVGDLVSKFGVPLRQAGQMMRMLQRGPEAVKQTINDTLHGQDLIDEQALSNFEDMQQVSRNLHDSWEELVGSLYKTFIPGITKVMNMVSDAISAWTPRFASAAKFLEEHMTKIVALAKAYATYMAVNKGLSLIGYGGGVKGVVKGIAKFASGASDKTVGVAGSLVNLAGQSIGGPIGSVMKFLGSFGISAGRLVAIGGALMAVIGAIYLIIKNTDGAMSRLKAAAMKVWDSLQNVRAALEIVFARDAPLGKFVQFLGSGLVWIFDKVLALVSKIMDVLATTFVFLSNVLGRGITGGTKYLARVGFGGAWAEAENEIATKRARERAMAASEDALRVHGNLNKTIGQIIQGSKAQVYQDFRGSKFDIQQNFAQEYEYDRIAAVFSNDLVKAAERRLQSGFSPIFGAR